MIERNRESSWEMLRARTGALAEGTAAFSLFVCFIFKHPEPLLDQHRPVNEGSRGVQDSGERGKQGWKLMIFPAMKVKMPAWNQTLWSTTQAWGRRGGKERRFITSAELKSWWEKRTVQSMPEWQQQTWKLICHISPLLLINFKEQKKQRRWLEFLKGGKKASEVPWSSEALNSYIPFIARAGMTPPLIRDCPIQLHVSGLYKALSEIYICPYRV